MRVQLSEEMIAGLAEGRRLRILLYEDSYPMYVGMRDASPGKSEDEGVAFEVGDQAPVLGSPARTESVRMEAFGPCSTIDGATLNANSPTIAVAGCVTSVTMVPAGHPLAVEEGMGELCSTHFQLHR